MSPGSTVHMSTVSGTIQYDHTRSMVLHSLDHHCQCGPQLYKMTMILKRYVDISITLTHTHSHTQPHAHCLMKVVL